jgi:O-antigen/teichoic acid export membrane protein
LTKKEIRTQYSGFILFAAKLLTVATGIVFTLLITTTVTPDVYGVWGKIIIIIPYFTLLSTAFPFWVMRFVARDKEGAAKTGIFANLGIASIATVVYLALLPLIIPIFSLENYVILSVVAAAQIVELYLISVLEGCLQAQQPHLVGYGLLIGELCKVTVAYVLMVGLNLSLLGALLGIVIAYGIKAIFYFKVIWQELKSKLVFSYVKEWIKGSMFNIYNIIGDRIAAMIFLMLAIYGGDLGMSFYQGALPIANIITYSAFLAFALYPKLLAESKMEEATASLKMVLMFAIPMTMGVLVVPDSYLRILDLGKGEYVPAVPVLMILAVDGLILTTSTIFSYVLYGIEKVDEKAQIPFKQVAKSRLFIAFSLPYVHSVITLPTAYYVLTNFTANQPLLVAIYVTGINTAAHFAMFMVQYIIVRKAVRVEIPWKNIAKYIFASAVMASILFVVHSEKTLLTLAITAIGGVVYLALLLLIDKEAKMLAKDILKELLSRFRATG